MKRHGFTTVELTVVLLIGGVIAAAIGTVLRRQQRFFSTAASVVEHRVSLRDATGILPAELRALSPSGGDVLAFSDSALDIRTTVGAAIACDTVIGGEAIDLAPPRSMRVAPLAAFSTTPQPSDIALVYDGGALEDASDDGWVTRDITGIASLSTVCSTSPLLDSADVALPRLRLRFSGAPLPSSVRAGAFVHVVRRVRYRLYRAATGDWYLGYAEWDGSAFGVVQPVSGPFASYSTRSASTGLLLRYFDAEGAEVPSTSDAPRIARVEVVARSVNGLGLAGTTRVSADSQAVAVRMRNR